jgi:hypothetical protein
MFLGDDGIRIKALEIVLQKLLEDPHHDSVPSVNYSNEKNSSINSYNHPTTVNDIPTFNDRMYSDTSQILLVQSLDVRLSSEETH